MVEGYETRRKIDFIIDKGVTDRKSNISNGKITSILLSSSTREGRKKEPRDIGSYEAYTGGGQVCKSQRRARIALDAGQCPAGGLRHWDRALSKADNCSALVLDGVS